MTIKKTAKPVLPGSVNYQEQRASGEDSTVFKLVRRGSD